MNYFPFVLGILLAMLLLYQFYPLIKARKMQGKAAPALDEAASSGEGPYARERLLVYFWSPGCGMCRNMTRVIDELISSRDDVVKVDASASPEVAHRFNVMATPTLVLIHAGTIEKVLLGARTRQQILELIA